MNHPAEASFAEFATLARFKRSYVTQLRKDDRLVLTDDGKRVRVAESLQRIVDTKDPSKRAVAARHEAARSAEPVDAPAPSQGGEEGDPEDEAAPAGYQHWRERSERAKALALERDYAIAAGKLLDAAEVASVVADIITQLRGRLEVLPDILGPRLAAETDENAARAMLAEEIEHALEEASRQFGALAKSGCAP